jgi:integrase
MFVWVCMKYRGFPIEIKKSSARAKIYRVKHEKSKGGFLFTTAWYSGSLRKTKQFANLDDAKRFAKERVAILASGDQTAIEISRSDLAELEAARKITGDVPLLVAVEEWSKARNLCDDELLSAARSWNRKNSSSIKRIEASEAVAQFLAAKKRQGVDISASYKRVLPHLEKRFSGVRLDLISTAMLQDWLDSNFDHAGTRNTVRKRVVTLFRWARKQGYLPKDAITEAEDTEAARENPHEIGIISPGVLRQCLSTIREKAPHYLPALILAAHCGLRRSEIHGQRWEDIELDRHHARVSTAKKGTPARRLVPLSDVAIDILKPFESKGPVCSNLAIDRIRDICISSEIELQPNCFRHSFITYRCAATGDIARTSMEAGNSPKIIHRHYRELATEAEGREYFEVGLEVAK